MLARAFQTFSGVDLPKIQMQKATFSENRWNSLVQAIWYARHLFVALHVVSPVCHVPPYPERSAQRLMLLLVLLFSGPRDSEILRNYTMGLHRVVGLEFKPRDGTLTPTCRPHWVSWISWSGFCCTLLRPVSRLAPGSCSRAGNFILVGQSQSGSGLLAPSFPQSPWLL
jgi:hypothetical protein